LKMVTISDIPLLEFTGHNIQICREQGNAVKSAKQAVHSPLIDMVPPNPNTIMTGMVRAQKLTNDCG